MNDPIRSLITWRTYGTWLPGEMRGWRKRAGGEQLPRPLLERWCREQMTGQAVFLSANDRATVEDACREHCEFRGWHLFAVNARSNHVHVVVAADEKPQKVRDQLKANCTRRLRRQEKPLVTDRTWTRGGDCSILDGDDEIENAVVYVVEAQERMGLEDKARR
ncbi:MAG: transposase [bacterium]|nr:transposase [bacterium]